MAFPPTPPAYIAVQDQDWLAGVDLQENLYGLRDQLFQKSDARVFSRLRLADPRELPLFQGLGRLHAWRQACRRVPDMESVAAVVPTLELWDDEWQKVEAPLQPGSDRAKAAAKVCGLMDMLNTYSGQHTVDTQLQTYFNQNHTGPQSFRQVYETIRRAAPADRPFPRWSQLEPWLTQAGHPILNSELLSDGSLRISQQPFTLYPSDDYRNQGATFTVPLAGQIPG